MLLSSFMSSIIVLGSPPKVKYWRRKPHVWRRREVKWRRGWLKYCLVQPCHCCKGQNPPRLDGPFKLPHFSKHLHWSRIDFKEIYYHRRRFNLSYTTTACNKKSHLFLITNMMALLSLKFLSCWLHKLHLKRTLYIVTQENFNLLGCRALWHDLSR